MGRKSVSQEVKWKIAGPSKDKTKSQRKIGRLCSVSLCCVQISLKNYKFSNEVKDSTRVGRQNLIQGIKVYSIEG